MNNETIVGHIANNDMDTMADTSCAGANWRVVEPTGHTCDVYAYNERYDAIKDVPIATCATVVPSDNGLDFLLIGHEMLYFGTDMKRSLLNQNQIRHHIHQDGGVVQDDFTRGGDFGIRTGEAYVPFYMDGSAVSFDSRVPSDLEMETLPRIVITSQEPWDPKSNPLRISSVSNAYLSLLPGSRETDAILQSVSPALDEDEFRRRAIASVYITDRGNDYDGPGPGPGPRTDRGNDYDGPGPGPQNGSCNDGPGTVKCGHIYGPGPGPGPGHEYENGTRLAPIHSTLRHSDVSPENLSRTWNVGLETARRTLRVTTQHGTRSAIHPITRRYRADHLHLNRKRLNTTFYTDGLHSRVVSLHGNKCAQVFTNGRFTAVYPTTTKSQTGDALRSFTEDVGIPDTLIADLAGEQSGQHTDFVKQARHLRIRLHHTEKGRKNQNHTAEREIGILKQRWKDRMTARSIPSRLWDYGLVYEAEIISRTCRTNYERTGIEELTGDTPNIAEWLDFGFYDLVWYFAGSNDTTTSPRKLGRWLGVSHRVGSSMCYWILTRSGQVISSTTVQHVTGDEHNDPQLTKLISAFDTAIADRLDDTNFIRNDLPGNSPYIQDEYSPPMDQRRGIIPSDDEYGDMIHELAPDDDDHPDLDTYIHAQLMMEVGGEQIQGRVIQRAKNDDGSKKGKAHKNPLFDTRAYMVEFKDGSVSEYTANIIAENIYSQVDEEGRSYSLLQEISGHRHDESAIRKEDGYDVSYNGNRVPKKTTKGWQIQVEWKDGNSEWLPLKRTKDNNPVELAEYAVANKLEDEPAFRWWVQDVLRRRSRIIGKMKSKYWRTTHKFGVRLPKDAAEALRIDEETGTDFWRKALEKELRKVRVAWEVRDDLDIHKVRSGKELIGYTEITCHMVFDVKMDFTRKARFVAGGHLTDAPETVTYSSVVSRDSVRIALLAAELNGLDVMSCDVGNAYLNAPCREKVWFKGGLDTGDDMGKVSVITRALYGLRSSGASWRAMLARTLEDFGFQNTMADPDVWRRHSKRENGTEYYELLLVYVDDILLVSHQPKPTLEELGKIYALKDGSLDKPEIYLGAQLYEHFLPDGRKAWAMASDKYVKSAVTTVEDLLKSDGDGSHLKTTAKEPVPTSYRPELDVSEELNAEMTSRYRQLVGILRWAVELGRVDIYHEVALLSQYLAAPRVGHLETLYHVFAYLKSHQKFNIVFDPKDVRLDESAFANTDIAAWRDFYGDVAEELPPKMPDPLGNGVDITCFVDSDHAGNLVTRRSHTGILIFLQNAPIIWFSKKQNTIESSSFGSEFVALRIARDMIVALRYKLRMFGIPIRGPASVLCDNQGVVKNASLPESALSKRHNAINYNVVREAVAAGIIRVGKEDGTTNLADAFTKILNRRKRYDLFSRIGYSSMFRDSTSGIKRDVPDSHTDRKGKKVKFVT